MEKYPEYAVEDAARYAYSLTPAGRSGNTEYVEMKTKTFVERCKNFNFGNDVDDDGYIGAEAIRQICYSALDESTERMLWQFLRSQQE